MSLCRYMWLSRLHNNSNTWDNVYGAVIVTQVILRVHLVHLMNVEQT